MENNLSEEEIIKTVENFLDGYRQFNVETGETYVPYKYGQGQKFCCVEDFEAIQGLLDLYNKEKEQNRVNIDSINNLMKECNEENKRCMELAIELDKEKEKNKELKILIEQNLKYSHNLEKDLFENCSNYVVSKDKIRGKIKEYEGLKEMDMQAYEEQVKPLKELLEEE